jgi:phospholipase C
MLLRLSVFLAAVGLVLVAACSSNGTGPGASPALPGVSRWLDRQASSRSSSLPISHVIVIVQENRSFENFFAGYPGADAPMTGCASSLPDRVKVDAIFGKCPAGDTVVPLAKLTFKTNPDLRHDWKSSMVDWDKGKMDGFSAYGLKRGADTAYNYIDRKQTKPYWTMARQYVLADKMFPTEFGGSFTAHLTLVAGTDDIKLPGHAEVNFPNGAPDDCDSPPGTKSSYVQNKPYRKVHLFQGPFPCFDQFNSIAEVLDRAGIAWKFYATRRLDAGFWEPFEALKYVRYGADWKNIIAPQNKILKDAAIRRLASVSWVTPTAEDSDHPQYRSDTGPSWVASVVNAIGESPYWSKSAIIVLWDDWGGFYDNAAPPQYDYRGLGIRVPCIIISPYAKQGYVSHVQYEFGSILRFIEEVNGLPAGSIGSVAQGYTDGRATGLDDAFNFSQKPRPFIPILAKYPSSYFLNEPPSNEPVDTE